MVDRAFEAQVLDELRRISDALERTADSLASIDTVITTISDLLDEQTAMMPGDPGEHYQRVVMVHRVLP